MEGLSPPLKCLIEVRSSLQNGESVRTGILRFIQSSNCEFSTVCRQFLFDFEQGADWRARLPSVQSAYRRAMIELLAIGLSGEPIQTALEEMQKEIQSACEAEIKSRIDMLPLQMLFPLLLLMFPAYLLLLFGPLVSSFVQEMGK
jgi:hypothetical protein